MFTVVTVVFVVLSAVSGNNESGSVAAPYDTIVVGLGAAGCAAAGTLAQAGRRVLALEAQGRVGGRVNTVSFGDGIVELGAEWIHGTVSSPTYNLAVTHNVSLASQGLSFTVYRSDGTLADQELVGDLMDYALNVSDDRPVVPEPMGQYITKRLMSYIEEKHPAVLNDKEFIDEFLQLMDLLIDTYEATTTWNEATTETKYEPLGGDQYASWHRHGYKTLFEILLNTYKNGAGYPTLETKLNAEVTQISWSREPSTLVQVTCKDGTTYSANNVIVTVSIGVLKERHTTFFSPQLPPSKITAIDKISMGVLGKIVLSFADVWWPKNMSYFGFLWRPSDRNSVVQEDLWTTKLDGPSKTMGSDNTLVMWVSGDYAKYNSLFTPQISQEKITAIENISMGVLGKIILSFDKPWWTRTDIVHTFFWTTKDKGAIAASDLWTTKIVGLSTTLGCSNAITIWTNGNVVKLVETLPEDVVIAKSMELIRRFMGTNMTIPEPTAMIRSNWHSNPFTRGSYTYDNLLTPQYPNTRVDLSEPLLDTAGKPRVLFAGEASNPTHFSTVHGAVETGYREAMRLLATNHKA